MRLVSLAPSAQLVPDGLALCLTDSEPLVDSSVADLGLDECFDPIHGLEVAGNHVPVVNLDSKLLLKE